MDFDLATYYPILIFLVVVIAIAGGALAMAHLVGPLRRTPVKQMPYESGMDPVGDARQRFDVRFYLVSILFLVFDVELLFLYPWAVSGYELFTGPVLIRLQTPIFWGIMVFILLLVVGFVYDWRKGAFRWR